MLEQWKAGSTGKLERSESWKSQQTWNNSHDKSVSCTKIRVGTLSVLDKYFFVSKVDVQITETPIPKQEYYDTAHSSLSPVSVISFFQ